MIYAQLDERNRIVSFTYNELSEDVIIRDNYVIVELPEEHPIVSLSRTNYRYEDGEWIEDNSLYEESLELEESLKNLPTTEERIEQLENVILMLMMMN